MCRKRIQIVFILILALSIAAQLLNHFIYQYPGNNYFPTHTGTVYSMLVLLYAGTYIQFGANHRITECLFEIICFFSVMALLIFATNAAQYTPFSPIDQFILKWQRYLPLKTETCLAFANEHPILQKMFKYAYTSLTYQMAYIPLFMILLGHKQRIREYYFLLLLTGFIGYLFYYFFPTTAPASVIASPYFEDIQKATGLKFYQIHAHIPPTTLEGGMIAFPSFHIIWAYLCVYLVRGWWPFMLPLIAINIVLTLSCFYLGWHYFLDLFGSICVILFAHWSLHSKYFFNLTFKKP